jgi:hypothetical protein
MIPSASEPSASDPPRSETDSAAPYGAFNQRQTPVLGSSGRLQPNEREAVLDEALVRGDPSRPVPKEIVQAVQHRKGGALTTPTAAR